MATTYKTPGVYIEEIVKFPPSVAQVETAIPAFIGYTEKAMNKIEDDLDRIPTRITSLLDYETYFGLAYPEDSISVNVTDVVTNNVTERNIVVNQPSDPRPFLMYYSLQMYFANGGGPCYIISVGKYEDINGNAKLVFIDDLKAGLDLLKAEDEPTLILFPDAKALPPDKFCPLYANALIQCHDMQDRFTIIDTQSSTNIGADSKALRDGLSLEKDYLKYGAAYYPYLETILNYRYNEDDILINHFTNVPDAISTASNDIDNSLLKISPTISSILSISNEISIPANDDTVKGKIANVLLFIDSPNPNGFNLAAIPPAADYDLNLKDEFAKTLIALTTDLTSLISEKQKIKNAANSVTASVKDENSGSEIPLGQALGRFVNLFEGSDKIESVKTNLEDLTAKMLASKTSSALGTIVGNIASEIANLFTISVPSSITKLPDDTLTIGTDVFNKPLPAKTMIQLIKDIKTEITTVISKDTNNGAMNGRFLGDIEGLDNKSYNAIKAEILALPLTLPPSSSVAGIYARVDSDRGVWKAPANVGINYVIKPTLKITNDDLGNLNIDTIGGKSINAIKSSTGNGTLVWGARTLAGNDKEWRYVQVRRFFIMAEESIKKATEQFIFESNDANTWIRVRAMIENFLILQWRAGALAGAKYEDAFYVKIGLGQTMSAMDILDGLMIVEIGMAVVRPAEFILLRFSHKMQES
ncbi:phage tail sheath subtilisin-like domain-containing protein [Flavobacterium sp. LS1R49]|uniref:Phage tail sheath subtilisin-like domain-containing protein n=1 Tax=Flavobacterium shii TaxID=2987687 RepID=A0A9X3C5G9_9FLAO|nr:phage tail sheath C-terminal domain-containing protein [Flavobacterium shii]MCV9930359.1 phage tail sheath subtilisin-like domain-containing protein [Flavobacterium shii]